MYQSVREALWGGAAAFAATFALFMMLIQINDVDSLKNEVTRQRCELMGLRYEIDAAKAAKLEREQSNE